jgi:hypothetical protein
MLPIRPDRAKRHIPERGECQIQSNGQPQGFEKISDKDTGSKAKTDGEKQSTSLISEMRPSSFSNERAIPTHMVVDHVQRLIDTMESYQQKLTKKKICLNEIRSLIKKMTVESESLSKVSKQLSATDSLRSIVNQSLILSSAEIVKFKSGFYDQG